MLSNIIESVKRYRNEIMLAIIVALISLLSLAIGYIAANYQGQQDIKFIESQNQ
jgi:hypothetical protein